MEISISKTQSNRIKNRTAYFEVLVRIRAYKGLKTRRHTEESLPLGNVDIGTTEIKSSEQGRVLKALLARVKDHGKTAGCNKAWNGMTNNNGRNMDT